MNQDTTKIELIPREVEAGQAVFEITSEYLLSFLKKGRKRAMDYLPTDPQNDMNTAPFSMGFSSEKLPVGPASISVLCSHCGALGYSVDKYCACCGYELARFCNHCGGAVLHPVANYCTQCGRSFAESVSSEDSMPEKEVN